jgi:hypothetical protein
MPTPNDREAVLAYEAWCKPRMNNVEPDHPQDAFVAGYRAALASDTGERGVGGWAEAGRELYEAEIEHEEADRERDKCSRLLAQKWTNPGYAKTEAERESIEAANKALHEAAGVASGRHNKAAYRRAIARERCAALRAQPAGGGDVVALMDKFRALVAAHDGEFAFVDGVKLCLRELEAAIAGCHTEGRELPKYFVEYSECEKAAYMRGIAVGENIASRDPVFAALDSVVPGWREHGSDTASAAATVITELSARATSNGSRPFRWDDDEGEAPSAWGPK